MHQIGQEYLSDDDSNNAIQGLIMEDCEFVDDDEMCSGQTTRNSATPARLPPVLGRTSVSTSESRSSRSTPKTAWDEVCNESNSPLPHCVVKQAHEYLNQGEARSRALKMEQQRALTEYMIFGARSNIDDINANGAIPLSANSNSVTAPPSSQRQRLPRLRREELSGVGISKCSNGYAPTLFSTIEPAPVKYGQLTPLSSQKR